jgi:hypothetical protein
MTPLLRAAKMGDATVVRLLLEHGRTRWPSSAGG